MEVVMYLLGVAMGIGCGFVWWGLEVSYHRAQHQNFKEQYQSALGLLRNTEIKLKNVREALGDD